MKKELIKAIDVLQSKLIVNDGFVDLLSSMRLALMDTVALHIKQPQLSYCLRFPV
jgi:hypothetical protein